MSADGGESLHASVVTPSGATSLHILFLDECPICYANRMHFENCSEQDCGQNTTYYDKWVERAVRDEVERMTLYRTMMLPETPSR